MFLSLTLARSTLPRTTALLHGVQQASEADLFCLCCVCSVCQGGHRHADAAARGRIGQVCLGCVVCAACAKAGIDTLTQQLGVE
eukprot:g83490.t1